MTAAIVLSIALAVTATTALATVWWHSRKITSMATSMTGLTQTMAVIQTELMTSTLERERAKFELVEASEALRSTKERLQQLEKVLADIPTASFGAGLAVDDARGRVRTRVEAHSRAGGAGGVPPISTDGVPKHSTTTDTSATGKLPRKLPDV